MARTRTVQSMLSRRELLEGIQYKEVLTTDEVAAMMNLSPHTIRNKIRELPHYKNGHTVFFKKSEIVDYMCAVQCTPATI